MGNRNVQTLPILVMSAMTKYTTKSTVNIYHFVSFSCGLYNLSLTAFHLGSFQYMFAIDNDDSGPSHDLIF
jgi:hypothetical protein